MPRGQIVKRENIKLVKKMSIVVGIVLIVSILMDVVVLGFRWSYSKEVADQNQQINTLSIAEKYKNAYDLIDKKLKYRESVLDKIANSGAKVTTLMNDIEEIIPSDISLSNLSIDKDSKVTLGGTGDNTESVLDFYHSLTTSGLSDYISFNSIKGTLGDPKGIDFVFTFILKNGK